MSTLPKSFITPEQYLEIERKADHKSEYFNGEIFAMAGAKRSHNRIAANMIASLHPQLRGARCGVYTSDMRVLTGNGLYTYPDVVVSCGKERYLDDGYDTLLNPTLIVEVLSRSTEDYDRGRKFKNYLTIESLQAYLMVSSEKIGADLWTRRPDGSLLVSEANRMDDVIELEAVGCRLKLADLYEGVDWSTS